MKARTVSCSTGRVLALLFALATGVVLMSFAGSAYAAQDSAAAGDTSTGDALVAAQYSAFTTASNAPTARPSNTKSNYEVYSTYLNYSIWTDANLINYNLYMEICPVGKKWSKAKTYEFGTYMKTYTIKNLKSHTKYKTRLYYGLSTSVKGPYSKTAIFTTGYKAKPPIKSVKAKAINVKKHYQKIYGYYTGVYRGKVPYYTYKIRTTVTLKKVPKSKYIMINGKVFKANKKRYVVTTSKLVKYYSKPRGDKYKISVCTLHNKTWKGYSLLYQKTRKI